MAVVVDVMVWTKFADEIEDVAAVEDENVDGKTDEIRSDDEDDDEAVFMNRVLPKADESFLPMNMVYPQKVWQ